MSVYVVFVSLFVWGWILGPIGFLIGVPINLDCHKISRKL